MRRVYFWVAAAVIAFAVYGSLLPFRLKDRTIEAALSDFAMRLVHPWHDPVSRTNIVANVLLFVPLGFALMGARLAERTRNASVVAAVLMVVPLSLFVSVGVEFLQQFAVGRISSRIDIMAQTAGCVIGIAAWIWMGPALTTWLRGRPHPTSADRFARVLAAYAALWALASLAPFDVTVDVGTLGRRLRTGLITFVPFGSPAPPWRQAWDALTAAVSAVPLGMFALVGWTRAGTRRRTTAAWALGTGAVAAIEAAQIFIRSHGADITDVLFGSSGVAVGVWVGVRVLERTTTLADTSRTEVRGAALALTAIWALIICGFHLQPFNFGIDMAIIGKKLSSMSLVPFAGYRAGSDLNALNNFIAKVSVAAPLGFLAAFAVPAARLASAALLPAWIAAATIFFAIVEIGQLFVPSRVPDPTDVLIGMTASLAGLWVGRWLRRR